MNWALRFQQASSKADFGGSNPSVGDVQTRLNALGAQLTVDGAYGPASINAVKTFQSAHGLSVDGKVGPMTLNALGFTGANSMVSGGASGVKPSGSGESVISNIASQFQDLVAFAQKYGQSVIQGTGIAPGFKATRASVVNSFVPWSGPLEGNLNYPYTDAHGLVTTGMGNLIDAMAPGQILNVPGKVVG